MHKFGRTTHLVHDGNLIEQSIKRCIASEGKKQTDHCGSGPEEREADEGIAFRNGRSGMRMLAAPEREGDDDGEHRERARHNAEINRMLAEVGKALMSFLPTLRLSETTPVRAFRVAGVETTQTGGDELSSILGWETPIGGENPLAVFFGLGFLGRFCGRVWFSSGCLGKLLFAAG